MNGKNALVSGRRIWYPVIAVSPCPSTGKEVKHMSTMMSFVLSVAAGIVSYYICKWLDEQFFKSGKH